MVFFSYNRQKPRSTVTQLQIRSLQRLLASPAARTQEWLVQQRSWVEGHRTIELGRHVHFHVLNASLSVLFELQPLDCLNFLYFIFPSVKFDEFEL
ncbi:hypothetical protein RHMOL_Rhmol08G0039300 [Rhododendron molle]|uniref:Uncharacterized protein n=1 Tax=Rhododendron molle TaxID=49168 RepID=A0ACC0MJS7_RHOML|nr:hypothetical protein RHMOL_Rhmol08G0039300 [Rhododendron molle]